MGSVGPSCSDLGSDSGLWSFSVSICVNLLQSNTSSLPQHLSFQSLYMPNHAVFCKFNHVYYWGHRHWSPKCPTSGYPLCSVENMLLFFFLYFWWPLRASCVNLHTAARAAGNHTHKQNKIMLSPFIALTYWFCSVFFFFVFFILSGLQNWRTADLLWESTRVSEERAGVLFLQVRERHSTHLATL